VGLAHERSGNAATAQKDSAKKMAARRAAKFREETPRKGGGFAIEDRNTALQQYAPNPPFTQDGKFSVLSKKPQGKPGNFPFINHVYSAFFAMVRRDKCLVSRSGCADSHQCRLLTTKDSREAFR
jgi:hypothetical protein